MTRGDGYYWVWYKGEWEIGEWRNENNNWLIESLDGYLLDHDFDEIDERRIER